MGCLYLQKVSQIIDSSLNKNEVVSCCASQLGTIGRKTKALCIKGVYILALLISIPNAAIAKEVSQSQVSVEVTNVQQLRSALNAANKAKTPTAILLADGIYKLLGSPLKIVADNITIRSQSGIRENVVIAGSKMDEGIGVLIDVSADYFTLVGVTLKNARWHLIQVRAEKDADFFHLNNCILQDAGQQLLKVSHAKNGPYANFGVVKNSLFEYTAGIGPNYYIGGIDAHHSVNWLVQNNTFKNIASPAKRVAEHAIHFWKDSKNNRTLNNLIINSDRGIGYGLTNSENQNEGGIISNNIIVHTASNHLFADVGIGLESSPNTVVTNNIIFSTGTYPNAIEYRFKRTTGVFITGNVTNKAIKSRDGATATVSGNKSGVRSSQLLHNIQHLIKEK
ncbi:MAG: hypothetical protein ACJA0G_000216 [Kangiellaceae bacterium]